MKTLTNELSNTRENLLRLTEQLGLNLPALAHGANLDPTKIRRFIVGEDSLTVGVLVRLCNAIKFPFWAIHIPKANTELRTNKRETHALERAMFPLIQIGLKTLASFTKR